MWLLSVIFLICQKLLLRVILIKHPIGMKIFIFYFTKRKIKNKNTFIETLTEKNILFSNINCWLSSIINMLKHVRESLNYFERGKTWLCLIINWFCVSDFNQLSIMIFLRLFNTRMDYCVTFHFRIWSYYITM